MNANQEMRTGEILKPLRIVDVPTKHTKKHEIEFLEREKRKRNLITEQWLLSHDPGQAFFD